MHLEIIPVTIFCSCEDRPHLSSEDEARVYRTNAVEEKTRDNRMATAESDCIDVTDEAKAVAVAVAFYLLPQPSSSSGPSFITALREQLGLKLEPAEGARAQAGHLSR
jgi:hypothetical protein